MIVTIDGINREEKETQYGMKQRVGLKLVEQKVFDINGTEVQVNDRWLNGMLSLGNNGTENWKKGDKVNIAITEKEGKYLNFKVVRDDSAPKSSSSSSNDSVLKDIQDRLAAVESQLKAILPAQPVVDPTDDF